MKHTLLRLFLICLSIPVHAQWWVPQNSGVSANLNDVYCLTPDIVVTVGDQGTILKTVDGGAHWMQKSSGTTHFLRKVQFANTTTGYAVGASGTLLKTTDAGENWNLIPIGSTADLYGLSVVSENTVYISGKNGLIQKTVDGGVTFTDQSYGTLQFFKNIQFVDASTGYAASYDYYGADSNAFIKTTDGGLNWAPALEQNTSFFYFMDQNVGFIKDGTGFHKTTDGGQTLTDLMIMSEYEMADMFAFSESQAWQISNNLTLCNCATFCIHKINIADPENPQMTQNCRTDTNGGVPFEAIHFANPTTGYVVGWSGTILKNATGNMENMATAEFDKDAVRMYPNPASDWVTISFGGKQSGAFSVELTDFLGHKITARSYDNQNDATINIESLAPGIYFLKLQSTNGTTLQKLVKK